MNVVILVLLCFLSEPEEFNFNSFDDLFKNDQIETHIYDSRTDDDVGSQDEKSPNFDIEDLPLPYYGTYHTDDSSIISEKEDAENDPLQSLFPYYNNTSPVQSEFELNNADVGSALNTENILQGSFVFPVTEVKALFDVPEIKEAIEPNAKISDDKLEELFSIPEVPSITQSFEPPKLLALTESLVNVPDIKEAVKLKTKISEDEIVEFNLIPEVEVETIVMDPEELIEVIGKDKNQQILQMIMNDGIEIIEIEPEPMDQSLFKMDKDEEFLNESSSRGDRDLSEEMIRIEDHILLPFFEF